MIDPVTAMAIANAAISVGERVADGIGRSKAKKQLARLQDPIYNEKIPDGILEAVARTKNLGSSFMMPGQDNLETAQDNILAQNVDSINNLSSSSSEGLQALMGAYGNRTKAQNQIGFESANSFQDRQGNVVNELNTLGGYQKNERDKSFAINVENPFLRHYTNIMSTLAGYQKAIAADNSNIKGGLMAGTGNLAKGAGGGEPKSTSGQSMVPAWDMENYSYTDYDGAGGDPLSFK